MRAAARAGGMSTSSARLGRFVALLSTAHVSSMAIASAPFLRPKRRICSRAMSLMASKDKTGPATAAISQHAASAEVRPRTDLPEQEFVAALAFDLETTGLDVRTNEIVQIAIVVANSNRGAKFSRLVLPEGRIDPGAAAVHGLTRAHLLEQGAQPFAQVWDECEQWLTDTLGSDTRPVVWAAHNGKGFDRPVLLRCVDELYRQRAAEEAGETAPAQQPSPLQLSPLLRSPRAAWIDTLVLARKALPRRSRGSDGLGPHTLSSLYRTASGGRTLEGAHDALADAEALACVWKWLVEHAGADRESTAWAAEGLAGGSEGGEDDTKGGLPSPFQAHLQYHGYRLFEIFGQQHRTPSRRGRRAADGNTRSASPHRAAAGEGQMDAELASLLRVNGVGPVLARRLGAKGIGSYDELQARYERSGREKMLGWLTASMPGVDRRVLRKAVKGMSAEWGGS